jgi:hypothetical protein
MTKRIVWLGIAALLGVGSFAGGDTSIICGWAFLLWTVPFGAIWQFALSDLLPASATRSSAVQIAATIIVVAVAYIFWFVVVPKVVATFATPRGEARNAL